jgi:hypothetical protein
VATPSWPGPLSYHEAAKLAFDLDRNDLGLEEGLLGLVHELDHKHTSVDPSPTVADVS